MPLVWAHSEYVKLCRSLKDKRVFDMPPEPVQRYQVEGIGSPYAIWRFNHKCRAILPGNTLRLEVLAPAVVRWSVDGWRTSRTKQTRDTGLGVHVADLPIAELPGGTILHFTFFWPEAGHGEGVDFDAQIGRSV
jgi:glucoamylase